MSASTFKLTVRIGQYARVRGEEVPRDILSQWLWDELAPIGLVGIHEGTLLSEEAAKQGLETESWTLDAGEAPRERDWVAGQEILEAELFFETREGAEKAAQELRALTDIGVGAVTEQKQEDWDAQWKASFQGADVPPNWRICPPWIEENTSGKRILKINPGAGFGTGTHETTQLCLEALASAGIREGTPVLDFGSGSGILAIGAALLGARVDAVEIDPLAIDNARENAALNRVDHQIVFSRALGEPKPFTVVIANILRPVLLEFAEELVARLMPHGSLILSGLIESDVREVNERYSDLLGGQKPEVRALNEWRALVWKSCLKGKLYAG